MNGGALPVTATIGPDGGTLVTEGVRLDVPAGALDEDTTLRVRKLPKPPAGFDARSEVFERGPDGLQFKKEITVRRAGRRSPVLRSRDRVPHGLLP